MKSIQQSIAKFDREMTDLSREERGLHRAQILQLPATIGFLAGAILAPALGLAAAIGISLLAAAVSGPVAIFAFSALVGPKDRSGVTSALNDGLDAGVSIICSLGGKKLLKKLVADKSETTTLAVAPVEQTSTSLNGAAKAPFTNAVTPAIEPTATETKPVPKAEL